MKIYLDNCCFNRPFDDQSQMRIRLESEAKLKIQEEIRAGNLQFLTTDDGILKRGNAIERLHIYDPIGFIKEL